MLEFVIKADGRKERFDRNKLIQTAMRAGASKEIAVKITNLVGNRFSTAVSTHDIYQFVMDELDKISEKTSSIFGLRESIADLDSVSFEKYAVKILEANGYACEWNQIIEGRSIEHQIDIIAKKNEEYFYVECKRHYNPHRFCGLEVPLEVYARLEDLREGFIDGKNRYNFSTAWLFTNSKFSDHAKRYALKKGIMMTGWSSETNSIQMMIERNRTYPVTVLRIDLSIKLKLLDSGIITLQDVLSKRVDKDIIEKAKKIMQ